MSAENQGFTFGKWQQAIGTTITNGSKQITTSRAVLGCVIVNSHTSGTFSFANGTSTSFTAVTGTYTPATGSSVVDFKPMDAFPNGIFMLIGGTFNGNILYNDLP